jgi:hypothetical protein
VRTIHYSGDSNTGPTEGVQGVVAASGRNNKDCTKLGKYYKRVEGVANIEKPRGRRAKFRGGTILGYLSPGTVFGFKHDFHLKQRALDCFHIDLSKLLLTTSKLYQLVPNQYVAINTHDKLVNNTSAMISLRQGGWVPQIMEFLDYFASRCTFTCVGRLSIYYSVVRSLTCLTVLTCGKSHHAIL